MRRRSLSPLWHGRALPRILGLAALVLPFSGVALAQEEPTELGIPILALFSGIRGLDADSEGLAEALSIEMSASLQGLPDMNVRYLSDAEAIGSQTALDYMVNCTTPMLLDCSVLIGHTSGDRFAVFGTLERRQDAHWAEITLADAENGWESLAIVAEISEEEATLFATQVAGVLRMEMERILVPPLRSSTVDTNVEVEESREVEARELSTLTWEKEGGFEVVKGSWRRNERKVTVRDLERGQVSDAAKPWERLGMSPTVYARYKNSGLDLESWRERAAGRQGQVVFRPSLGFVRAPLDQRYLGQFARDPDDLGIVETYGLQDAASAGGPQVGASLGVGVRPWLEVDVGARAAWGTYTLEVRQEVGDQGVQPSTPTTFPTTSWFASAEARVVPLPASRVRPVVGVGLGAWRGKGVSDHATLSVQELPVFDGPLLAGPRLVLGGEARLSKVADVVVQLPVDLLLFGAATSVENPEPLVLTETELPSAPSRIVVGLDLGVQFRLGSPRGSEPSREGDDPDDL